MTTRDEFISALQAGDVAGLRALLDAEPGLLTTQIDGGPTSSPVLLAIYYGHPEAAQVLIERGAVLDLYEAAAAGQGARVEELLASDPAAIDAYAPDGFTALGLAAFFGHADLVDRLLTRGADANRGANNAMRVRPLHSAAANRDHAKAHSIAAALLAAGAEADPEQEGGFTPLHEAALSGKLELARLLLAHGADPRKPSAAGETAIDLARKHGHAEVLAVLER